MALQRSHALTSVETVPLALVRRGTFSFNEATLSRAWRLFAGTTEELGLSILQRSHALTSVETGGLWSIGPSRDGLQRSHALTSVET